MDTVLHGEGILTRGVDFTEEGEVNVQGGGWGRRCSDTTLFPSPMLPLRHIGRTNRKRGVCCNSARGSAFSWGRETGHGKVHAGRQVGILLCRGLEDVKHIREITHHTASPWARPANTLCDHPTNPACSGSTDPDFEEIE